MNLLTSEKYFTVKAHHYPSVLSRLKQPLGMFVDAAASPKEGRW